MRLGILGGTFDPVHYAHLLLAESGREQLGLDEVWFLPAAVPPHKRQCELAPAVQRVEMLELATSGHNAFRVCSYEIDKGGISYTVDTLSHFQEEDLGRELFFLMGADSLRDLPSWKDPARICEIAIPAVVCRVGPSASVGTRDLDFRGLEGIVPAARLALIQQHQVEMPLLELSSSEIRRRVAAGRSIRYQTPRAVEKYIETNRLYRSGG